ncbi:MAG TPA: SIS domain-containing protein [Candidatus Limnocylindrales bacterium]|nr:SIS domain-containing protein [Candidatus Limnocylindrales bacterium]
MNPLAYLADLETKPRWLDLLADRFASGNPWAAVPSDVDRVLFLGMGSSGFAAADAAHDLRVAGLDAAFEPSSADGAWPPDEHLLIVAISASGESAETMDAIERYRGRSPIAALTNDPSSKLAAAADHVVELAAGDETGGVACRTFQHTGLLLRGLEAHLTGIGEDLAVLTRATAHATAELLRTSGEWLPEIAATLASPAGLYLLAPVERLASALQGALMVREGPRIPAVACETGDWAHVDVYLTKTLDYRAIVFPGSRWDVQAIDWLQRRRSTFVAVGADVAGAARSVRYAGDDDPDVARYAEILIPELLAAAWWRARTGG